MSLLRSLTRVASSPKGKQMVRQAQRYAQSPQGRKQISGLRSKFRGGASRTPRTPR
jgi:hypothetical protein